MSKPRQCSVETCDRSAHGRGLCSNHWYRWSKHGDPLAGRPYCATPEEALRTRVKRDGECLTWTGARHSTGYGVIRTGGKSGAAHRVAFEIASGPIPEGMQVDHTCWNYLCVNPEHLRLATGEQNAWNKNGPQRNRKYDLPRGVHVNGKGFIARVHHRGVTHRLGTFSTPAEASAIAEAKRKELFGEYSGRPTK